MHAPLCCRALALIVQCTLCIQRHDSIVLVVLTKLCMLQGKLLFVKKQLEAQQPGGAVRLLVPQLAAFKLGWSQGFPVQLSHVCAITHVQFSSLRRVQGSA